MTSLDDATDTFAETMPHFDLYSQEHRDIKWALFDEARERCPVAHTDAPTGEFFVLTRYDDVRSVLEDWQTWSSTEVSPIPTGISLCPIDVDPPAADHLPQAAQPALLTQRPGVLRAADA